MEQSASKFTPMNVIIWCCVAVFVAVTIVVIVMLYHIATSDDATFTQYQKPLFKMVVVEIVAIGISVFGKHLGVGQMIKAAQNQEASA